MNEAAKLAWIHTNSMTKIKNWGLLDNNKIEGCLKFPNILLTLKTNSLIVSFSFYDNF